MKRLLILVLAFALSGCGAVAPALGAPGPTSAPQVVTVVVTQPSQQALPTPLSVATLAPSPIPTATVAPTEVPTEAATQPPQVIVVTATPQPGGGAQMAEQSVPASSGGATATATLPFGFGGNLFTSMSRSGSYFNLRCLPQDITFSVSTENFAATEVDLYYRMEDLTTNPIWYSPWKNFGKMSTDKAGNFTINVNTMQLSQDLRYVDRAWFDYEFVGINKYGDRVGGSAKISKQVLYLKDCP